MTQLRLSFRGVTEFAVAGFLLQEPAKLYVGTMEANITEHERSSIAFTYPTLQPGSYAIVVERNGIRSNAVPVTIGGVDAALSQGLGGPFAGTPKYTQFKIPYDAV
jgi:hypothetical protein